MVNKDGIFRKTVEILSESLDLEEESIKSESLLFEELGIESVEILEITFRIEQEFGIMIGESEFWNLATLIANNGMFEDGFSKEARDLVKKYFTIEDIELDKLQSPFDLYNYITVRDLVHYIEGFQNT